MRRTLFAVALASSLGIPYGSSSLLDPVCWFLSSLWSTAITKEGAGFDPKGVTKAGAGFDPDGLTSPAETHLSDEGAGVDPNGGK